MREEWLQNRLTIAEAEAAYMVQHNRLGTEPIPFGFQRDQWLALLAQMQEGDELWQFSNSQDAWAHRCGRAGIALVRNGKVVDSIVTELN
jgi:hypothetical protein